MNPTSCPCGSSVDFRACCGPALRGQPARTAEALMRSRFVAYVLHDEAYLRASWHPATRPGRIPFDRALSWTSLDVVHTTAGGPGDTAGTVTFDAAWEERVAGGVRRGVLSEISRFVHEDGRWLYVDGQVRTT